jgi:hypothetical protein
MADYTRPGRIEFRARGVDVNTPVDLVRTKGKFPILKNVIVGTDGTLESRPGLVTRYASTAPSTGKSPVHSMRRLNDTSSGTLVWALIFGVQDVIALEQSTGAGAYTVVDTGPYSTNPLSLAIYRPQRAVQPWMYVGDSLRMRKIRYDSVSASTLVHRIGLPAPTTEPVTAPATGLFKALDLFEPSGAGPNFFTRWSVFSGPGTINQTVPTTRVSTGASAVLFEAFSGSDQICLVKPASMSGIGIGTVLNANTTSEDILVTQVNRASAALTIIRILYDSGTTGLASIVLSASVREIGVNSMLFNSTVNEYVRVRAIVYGPDGTASLRVNTVLTWANTNSAAGVASFVCHPLSNPTGATLISKAMRISAVPAGTTPTVIAQTIALDLTQISSSSGTQPSTTDDYIHITIRINNPEHITEIKVYIDVDATTNDFAHNYYYRTITKSDITDATTGAQSAIDNRRTQVSRRVIERIPKTRLVDDPFGGSFGGNFDDPDAANVTGPDALTDPQTSRSQLGTGSLQWGEIRFRLSELQKVGTDDSRGLKDVVKIGISMQSTVDVQVDLDAWVLHGGFAADVDENQGESGYQYVYRARCSTTGTVSDISPLSRGPAVSARQRTAVQLAQYTAAAEVDYLDVFRIGGPLTVPALVGSVANTASPVFLDATSNLAALAASSAGGTFDINDPDLALWPVIDIPRSGTTTAVAGSTVQSAAQFNTQWAPGTIIEVNGIATTIYRMVSTSVLEVDTNLGSLGAVSWVVPEPVLLTQPLPILAGPYFDHLLGCGDPKNPGSLYFSKPKNVDSTSRKRRLEITSNSDPLQNIFVFNGRGGAFSSQRLYYLEYQPLDPFGPFAASETPNVKGLYARWAMAVGRRGVAWLASDGVYIMEGGGAKNLTDEDLRPLFPFGGKQGVDTNGISAPFLPNPVGAEERYLRLAFDENDNLRFVYRDASANLRCMVYDFALEGWLPMQYQAPVTIFYSEEGAGVRNLLSGTSESTARVLTVGGPSDAGTDAGTPFLCAVRTPAYDGGDPRGQKQVGDLEVDIDPGAVTVTVTPGFDNFATSTTPVTISGAGRLNPPRVIDFTSGSGQFARNVGLDVTWTSGSGQKPKLYLWEPAFLLHPEDTLLRASDYEFTQGMKYVRGIWIDADTANILRTVSLDYIDHNGSSQTYSITVNHPVKSRIYYAITPTPFYASTLRVHPSDANKWKLYGFELDADSAPPFASEPSPWTDDGDARAKFLQGFRVQGDTHGNPVSLQIQGDSGAVLGTFSYNSSLPSVIPFTFNPAVRTHLMRVVPLGNIHLFSVEWDWQSDSELVSYYEAQESSFDLPGWKHAREIYIAYSNAAQPLTLTLYADGVAIAGIPTLPASTPYTRVRILIPATKWKAVKAVLSSASNFRLYSRDCAIYYKAFASTGDFQIAELFGTAHRDRGIARI